jgi:hypothetical protein
VLPDSRLGWILGGATLAGAVGFGAFTASSAIFFTRFVGLSPGQVGVGVALAGTFGLVGAVLVGRFADQVGPRGVLVVLSLVQAGLFLTYAMVHTFGAFLVVVCALTLAERGAKVVRNAVIAQVAVGRERVRLKAYLRSVFNVGVSVGAAVAAVPLHLDTRPAYLALVVANSAAALVTAVLATALPRLAAPDADRAAQRWVALRDTSYLSVALLCGLIAVHHSLLVIAMPIWVATRTAAPNWVLSPLFLLNTVLAIALQVRMSRRAVTVRRSIATVRRGAWMLVPACVLFGVAAYVPAGPAVVVLVAAVVLLTLGELWTSVATWALSFDLAMRRAPGQYQGAFMLGMSVESMSGPLLATGVVLALGAPGWLLAAAVFLLLGNSANAVTRWASRSRVHLHTGSAASAPALSTSRTS